MDTKPELIWMDFHRELETFIFSRVKDRELTRDLLQDIFIKIRQHIDTLKDGSKLSPWIYQITRNVIHDHFRHQKARAEMPDPDHLTETPESEEPGLANCLKPFVDQLDPKYREALILTEFEGLSQKQLAQQLNISYSGAKSRVQRAKVQLKWLFTDCCHIEADRYGNIVDYHQNSNCHFCCD